MTRHRSRLQQILIEKQMRTSELAKGTRLSVRSIHNVSCGSSKSRVARDRIQQFLQTQVWEDVPFIGAAGVRFETGTIFVFSNILQAKEFAAEVGDGGERRGQYVRLSAHLQWTLNVPAADKAQPVGKAGDSIDIWCGEVPPDSPFAESLRNPQPNEEKSPARQRRGQGRAAKSKKASKPAAATGYTVSDQP